MNKFKWGEKDSNNVVQYPCHIAQKDVLLSKARIIAAIAGTGGGKSCLVPLWFSIQMLKHPQGIYLLCVPFYEHFNSSGLRNEFDKAFSGTYANYTYTTPSGAVIFIRSAEHPESLDMGIHADAVALDECGKSIFSYRVWNFCRARANKNNAPILLTSTPDARNFLYTEIFRNCNEVTFKDAGKRVTDAVKECGYDLKQYNVERKSSDGQYYMRQWPSIFNTSYSVDSFKQEVKADKLNFERRYLGAFSQTSGIIYPEFSDHILINKEPTDEEFRKHPAIRTVGGIDFGFSPDPAALIVGIECQDNRLYIVEEHCEKEMNYDDIAAKCRQFEEKWGVDKWYCDSSGKAAINELKRRGISAGKRMINDVEVGITMVNARIHTDRMKIFPHCSYLIDEATTYRREEKSDGLLKLQPTGGNGSHCLDALRYLITGVDYGRPLVAQPIELEIDEQQKINIERDIRLGLISPDPKIRAQQEHDRLIAANTTKYDAWFSNALNRED